MAVATLGCERVAYSVPCLDISWAFRQAVQSSDWQVRDAICRKLAGCGIESERFAQAVVDDESSSHTQILAAMEILGNVAEPERQSVLVRLLVHPRDLIRQCAIIQLKNRPARIRLPEEILSAVATETSYENQVLLATFSNMLEPPKRARLLDALRLRASTGDPDRLTIYGSLRGALERASKRRSLWLNIEGGTTSDPPSGQE